MEYHQRSPVGNEKIVVYMLDNFRLPNDFPGLVYLSQLLQAEAMRVGVEHWRRHPACSGALYWQLNDCWPVISWSGIDYYRALESHALRQPPLLRPPPSLHRGQRHQHAPLRHQR